MDQAELLLAFRLRHRHTVVIVDSRHNLTELVSTEYRVSGLIFFHGPVFGLLVASGLLGATGSRVLNFKRIFY
jgi:hypothetical protein